jgi:hypothetical protein
VIHLPSECVFLLGSGFPSRNSGGGHARFLRTFTSGSAEVSAHPGTLREVLASLDILSLELIGHWVLDMGWNHESSADHPQVCKAAPFDRHYNLCKYIIKALVL